MPAAASSRRKANETAPAKCCHPEVARVTSERAARGSAAVARAAAPQAKGLTGARNL